ncbi:MAG: S-adenosylmethionine-binding protein [Akkermansiaceae bacterium]|nr:S-adenosylmethionine-binding protein [Akkermansiaceae bacterium]NIT75565.1 S-adenosylmethionine-binding protein [Thermoplasmata archaeon]NIY01936.1 S-adenosylmethionine-binding protein [Thermoplasmata archaeon]
MSKYKVILADPPWQYDMNSGDLDGLYARHGAEMTLDDIQALPVAEWAEADAVLALWTTWPMLGAGLSVMREWGFTYRSAVPWVKTTPRGAVRPGVGFWVLGASEVLLFGSRGTSGVRKRENGKGIIGLLTGEPRQFWGVRSNRHSKKPMGVHRFLETFPGPYLELFARYERPGWTTWGYETGFRLTSEGVEPFDVPASPQGELFGSG